MPQLLLAHPILHDLIDGLMRIHPHLIYLDIVKQIEAFGLVSDIPYFLEHQIHKVSFLVLFQALLKLHILHDLPDTLLKLTLKKPHNAILLLVHGLVVVNYHFEQIFILPQYQILKNILLLTRAHWQILNLR